MREIVKDVGGRRLHNEDLGGIQDYITSMQSIFENEKPFIFSGIAFTKVSGQLPLYNVSSGYVWLGGKIRYFSGESNLNLGTDKYMGIKDVSKKTLYGDGIIRVSKTNYGTQISSVPAGGSNSLKLNDINGIRRYNNVNGDKFVKLNGGKQTIFSELIFQDNIVFENTLSLSNSLGAQGLDVDAGVSAESISLSQANQFYANNIFVEGNIQANNFFINTPSFKEVVADTGIFLSDTVATNSIVGSSVTEDKITDGEVTESKFADDSITTSSIVDGEVTESKLANNSVNTDNIVNDSITEDKLGYANLELVGMGNVNGLTVASSGTSHLIIHRLDLDGNRANYMYRVRATHQNRSVSVDGTKDYGSNAFTVRMAFNELSVNEDPIVVDVQYIIYKLNLRP